MTSERHDGSDRIGCRWEMDISQLAREFEIHPGELKSALDGAADVLRASRENVRPAEKAALRGVAKALDGVIERLSRAAVRERLVEAVFEEPAGPDEDGLARYEAWWAARDRVDRAIEGTRDLLEVVRDGETVKFPAGRPAYDDWTVAIGSLLEFWADDLGRDVTISGHPSDPRGVRPSPTLRFIHQCMHHLGEAISEQQCRTVLEKLKDERAAGCRF